MSNDIRKKMTREEALEQAIYALVDPHNSLLDFNDSLWHKEEPDNLTAQLILHESLLIPKPKFGKGDTVKDTLNTPPNVYEVVFRSYDPDLGQWFYSPEDYINLSYSENELELVEARRDD